MSRLISIVLVNITYKIKKVYNTHYLFMCISGGHNIFVPCRNWDVDLIIIVVSCDGSALNQIC